MAVHKLAFSLPKDLYRSLERARRATARTRSAVMQEALRLWLAREEEAAKIRAYVEGYRRKPETAREIAEAVALSREVWDDNPW